MRFVPALLLTLLLGQSCTPEELDLPTPTLALPDQILEALRRNNPSLLRPWLPTADDLAIDNIVGGGRPPYSLPEGDNYRETSAAYMTPMAPERLARVSKHWQKEAVRHFERHFRELQADLEPLNLDLARTQVALLVQVPNKRPLKRADEVEDVTGPRTGVLDLYLQSPTHIIVLSFIWGDHGIRMEELKRDGARRPWMEYRQSWASYVPQRRISDYFRLKAVLTKHDNELRVRTRIDFEPSMAIPGGMEARSTLTLKFPRELPEKELLREVDALLYSHENLARYTLESRVGDPKAQADLVTETKTAAPSAASRSEEVRGRLRAIAASVQSDLDAVDLKLEFFRDPQPWK